MKAILRSAFVVAAAASSLAIMGTSANAAGAAAFTGSATIDCFGCGVSTCQANLSVTGVVNGTVHVGAHAETDVCNVNEQPGVTCVVTGSANGTVKGAVNLSFNWTRVGATAVITTNGDIAGAGAAVFVAHVSGLPCGTVGLEADIAGAVAGA